MTIALEVAERYRNGAGFETLRRDYGLSRRQVRGILTAFVGGWRHHYDLETPRCRRCEIILARCDPWVRRQERGGECGYCVVEGREG